MFYIYSYLALKKNTNKENKMQDYNKTKVKVLHMYESPKGEEKSFVEYEDLETGRISLLMVRNFIKRYGSLS